MVAHLDDPIIRDLEIMAQAKNYGRWIYGQLEPCLGRRIIECGAGIGNFTSLLLERELVVATDAHDSCVRYLDRRFANAENVIARRATLGDPGFLELARYGSDTVVCVNVLEHVSDDGLALRHMAALIRSTGRVLVLVPAHPLLYGSMDRRLGHYRRYRKKELMDKFTRAGLVVERCFYMNAVGVVGWFINNRLLNFSDQSPLQIKIFDRLIVPWLRQVERLLNPPWGMSIIAIGRTSRLPVAPPRAASTFLGFLR